MARVQDRPPKDWDFSEAHREKHEKKYWRCPINLVWVGDERGTPGIWPELWREVGTSRGGGVVASILPMLALHTFPGREHGADTGPEAAEWSAWQYLSHRRIARFSGVSLESVGPAMRRLEARGLLKHRTVPPRNHFGGRDLREYRLHRSLYAAKGESYFQFWGTLLYGGHWAMLPGGAERQLYMTIACRQHVLNPEAWLESQGLNLGTVEEAETALREARSRHPLSLTDLERSSGLGRATVVEALEVLCQAHTVTSGKDQLIRQLVTSGTGERLAKWYATEPVEWWWNADVLNAPAGEVDATRARNYSKLAARRLKAKKQRTSAKLKQAAKRRREAIPILRT